MVTINGESCDMSGKTVAEILEHLGYNLKRVAVEMNENIVPKAMYGETTAQDGDKIEIVRFVGGG
ncbi:MAG: sulfur carrier protein ThiS [Ruminococcus sp.]|nr:sulfur carrier protein ThiS [Ruminococcus sp.]